MGELGEYLLDSLQLWRNVGQTCNPPEDIAHLACVLTVRPVYVVRD